MAIWIDQFEPIRTDLGLAANRVVLEMFTQSEEAEGLSLIFVLFEDGKDKPVRFFLPKSDFEVVEFKS